MKTTLFDLEQDILSCWHVTDDINLLFEHVMDSDKVDVDDVSNYLLGLKTIYNKKFQKCFDTFEKITEETRAEKYAMKESNETNDKKEPWNTEWNL